MLLSACEPDTRTTPRERPEPPAQYVAVFFEHEGRIVPEYHPLGEGEPERALWDLLLDGPSDDSLRTSVRPPMELLQAAEPDEGRLLLELDDGFWDQEEEVVFRAARQIVFTMGNLEEGRAVTLIDGLRPGPIKDPDGKKLDQPLGSDDFDPPLVQVVQPTAGTTVGKTIPIDLRLTSNEPVIVSLEVDEETIASTIIHGGRGELLLNEAPGGPATVEIEIDPDLTIEVPVLLPPRDGGS